jgi:SagB-type dehydrogenase family enzyme
MRASFFTTLAGVALLSGALLLPVLAQEASVITLPPPHIEGGKPLMQALKERKSTRGFSSSALSPEVLSDLLWAGFGINRPETDHRTAPSAHNCQEIDLYVALGDGLYVYDAKPHRLRRVQAGDLRGKTSGQAFAKEAPVVLVLVADYSRMKAKAGEKDLYAAIGAGCIAQNVHLFCASAGLGAVVHDLDRGVLAEAMKLRPDQKIVIAQAVGYPKPQSASSGGAR